MKIGAKFTSVAFFATEPILVGLVWITVPGGIMGKKIALTIFSVSQTESLHPAALHALTRIHIRSRGLVL